jgi:RNA 2',3'-cyclic 3'-phosphodiesterase
MIRLFIALRPPEAVRDVLLDAQDGVEGARWQDEDQLHLTLRFVGEVDRRPAEDLVDALGEIVAPPFLLEVRGVGYFERKGRTHTLWAGLTPSVALMLLQRKIERACQSAGFPREPRKFAPHITLARIGGRTPGIPEWLARHGSLTAPEWKVERFGLYESRLGKAGALYSAIAEWPLERDAPTNV